ncbi:MAG TPA: sulfur transferase domain-containing protein [Terriglobia bacterium]|nr:sulfur transferase domain-containing protein [Terriglobia bacterium]
MRRVVSILAIVAIGVSIAAGQSQVKKESVPGITNFAKLESTVACAGAITPAAVADIKKMGYASIINLREASEPGADIEAETAAAKAAKINYFHVPFNGLKPDPAAVDQFLKAITTPGAEPAFIHCSGGNRAASMWFIKRAVVDKWDTTRAMAEATDLGFTAQPLKNFAMEYVKAHAK